MEPGHRADQEGGSALDQMAKPANIWCAGQTFTADGRLVVFGGNLSYSSAASDWKGLNKVYTFNPWTRAGQNSPTCATGAGIRPGSGSLTGASPSPPDSTKPAADSSATRTWSSSRRRRTSTGAAPSACWARSPGTGNAASGACTRTCSPCRQGACWLAVHFPKTRGSSIRPGPSNSFALTDYQNMATDRLWGTGVLMPGGTGGSSQVMQLGGSDPPHHQPRPRLTSLPRPQRSSTKPIPALAGMQDSPCRSDAGHHNTVLLPDGSMVTVGGGVGISERQPVGRRRSPTSGRALGPGHRRLEARRRPGRDTGLPLHRSVASRRPRDLRRGRRQRRRRPRHSRDLRTSVPVQGSAPGDRRGAANVRYRPASTSGPPTPT